MSAFGRTERVQVETDLLLNDAIPVRPAVAAVKNTVGAFTFGGVRDILSGSLWRGFEGGLGVQLFFRPRPPAVTTRRMWNMRMSQPMAGPT